MPQVSLLTDSDPAPYSAGNYFTKLVDTQTELNSKSAEVETARGIEANLNARFTAVIASTDAINTDLTNNYYDKTGTEQYVQGQIMTGGVDWSTFGDPLDLLRLNAAGTAPEGVDPALYQTDWSTKGTANQVIVLNGAANDVVGVDQSSLLPDWSTKGTTLQAIRMNAAADDIEGYDLDTAINTPLTPTEVILNVPSTYTYIEDAKAYLNGKTWSKATKVIIRVADGIYTPSTAETNLGYIDLTHECHIILEGTTIDDSWAFTNHTPNVVSNAAYDKDITLTLSDATGLSTNDFISIYGFTGGTAHHQNRFGGVAEISGIIGNDITYDSGINSVTSYSSGSGSVRRFNTVIKDLYIQSLDKPQTVRKLGLNQTIDLKCGLYGNFILNDIGIRAANVGILATFEKVDIHEKVHIATGYSGAVAPEEGIFMIGGKVNIFNEPQITTNGSCLFSRGSSYMQLHGDYAGRCYSGGTECYGVHGSYFIYTTNDTSVTYIPTFGTISADGSSHSLFTNIT